MKYVYSEPIISTVSDEELTEDKAIIDLLNNLKKMQHGFFIKFSDPVNPDNVRKLDNVRIINITDTTIDVHAFFSNASAKIKNIPFNNIYEIRLLANRQLLSQKYKVTRWHMLDCPEIG